MGIFLKLFSNGIDNCSFGTNQFGSFEGSSTESDDFLYCTARFQSDDRRKRQPHSSTHRCAHIVVSLPCCLQCVRMLCAFNVVSLFGSLFVFYTCTRISCWKLRHSEFKRVNKNLSVCLLKMYLLFFLYIMFSLPLMC